MNERRKERKIDKKKLKRNKIAIVFVTCIVVIALVYGFYIFYNVVNSRIIRSSIQNMEELSLHDEKSILSGLEHRWTNVKGIAAEMRLAEYKSITELQKQLNVKAEMINCIEVNLITEEGKVFSSKLTVNEKDEDIFNLCEASSEKFAYRRDSQGTHADARKELLMVGAKIKPFTVEGNRFKYIVSYYSIDALKNELKIDSYNSKGYSSVIDLEGNYSKVDSGNKYYYCFQEEKSEKGTIYYNIRVFFKFNLPVIGDITTFKIEGRTNPFIGNDNRLTK